MLPLLLPSNTTLTVAPGDKLKIVKDDKLGLSRRSEVGFFLGLNINLKFILLMKGTIKKLTDRGFGFITPEGDEKDLFFHSNDLKDVTYEELNEGDEVEFEMGESEKGPKAVDVTRS